MTKDIDTPQPHSNETPPSPSTKNDDSDDSSTIPSIIDIIMDQSDIDPSKKDPTDP